MSAVVVTVRRGNGGTVNVARNAGRSITLVQAQGPAGNAGQQGSQILYGSAAPLDIVGMEGDTWINTTNGDFYKKQNGTWGTRVATLTGPTGWAPVFASVTNGTRQVFKLADWTGGSVISTKPSITDGSGNPLYVGSAGWVTDPNTAIDMLGKWGWSPVYGIVSDVNRRVYQLVDYVGGTGTKPSVLSGSNPQYLSATGLTTTLASATDIRGPTGAGTAASNCQVTPTGNIASTDVQSALAEVDSEKVAKAGDSMSNNLTFSTDGKGTVFSQGGSIFDQPTGGSGGTGRTVIEANNDSLDVLKKDGTASIFTARYGDAYPTFKGSQVYHAGTFLPNGQCRLIYVSATSIRLDPCEGNNIIINGTVRTIPYPGPTLTNTAVQTAAGGKGLRAFIYAYWTGTAIALEASTTTYAFDATNGTAIKSGDATRALVGMAITDSTAGNFFDQSNLIFVASWYKRRLRTVYNISGNGFTVTATTLTNTVSVSAGMLTWSDCSTVFWAGTSVDLPDNGTSGAVGYWMAGIDGATNTNTTNECIMYTGVVGNQFAAPYSQGTQVLSDNYHYATQFWANSLTGMTMSNVAPIIVGMMAWM